MSRRCFWTAFVLLVSASAVNAQRQTSGSSTGASTSGSVGSIGRNPSNTTSNTNQPFPGGRSPTSTSATPIFLSGKVMLDDGSPANPNIRIERVCGTTVRLEGHVDSQGRFSFQLGENNALDTDASDASSGIRTGSLAGANTGSGLGSGSGSRSRLLGCELRASYAGYHSDTLDLAGREMMDNPDVGTLVLHHIGEVQGTTTSLTTLAAPKQAKKQYDKGMNLEAKGKLDEAAEHFSDATTDYPQYAIAWFEMGRIAIRQQRMDAAQKAFESAAKADTHYVSPYDQLAFVAVQQSKWQEAADYSLKVIDMNPVEFPTSFWYNAVANYTLKRMPEAEKSARSLVRLDTQHHFPGAEKMLAQLMLDKGNRAEAVTHLRAYLSAAPKAQDADSVREMLTRLESSAEARPQ